MSAILEGMQGEFFTKLQHYTFFGLMLLVTAGFLWLVHSFIIPAVWAVVLALLFHPLCNRLTDLLRGQRSTATILTILIALLLVFVPLFGLGTVVVRQSASVYMAVSQADFYTYVGRVAALPVVEGTLQVFKITQDDLYVRAAQVVSSASGWLAGQAVGLGARTMEFIVKIFVMIYLLFFLLRDGKGISERLIGILPLGDAKERFLFKRFATTTRAIIKGSIIVAIVQGTLGAILFWIAGMHNPVLWGVAMALAALVPAVGPGIIWLPTGLILLALGHTQNAVIMLLGGALLIGTIDNILRPMLVGRDTNIPDAVVLLSILGGIGIFGLSGIILGPVIAALFLAVWQLFEEEYREQLITRG